MSLILNRRRALQIGAAGSLSLGMGLKPARLRAEPKKGGALRVAIPHGSTNDSLDPALVDNDGTLALNHALYNFLTEIAPDNSLIGELAESWESSADAKKWTFKLRKGVVFHNGKPLTVGDVIASLNYHRGPDSKSAAKAIVDAIADLRQDGDLTVVFELAAGNADFPYLMSAYHLAIKPSTDGSINPTDGIGTGPYMLEAFQPGVRYLVKRNPNYWKAGRAHFDTIEALTVADPTARMNALISGEVHVISDPDLTTIGLLQGKNDIRIETTTGNLHYAIPMMVTQAPFSDRNVRNALKYAIDRQQLVDTILHGYGKVGNDTPIGFANRYRATEAELAQKSYDPDRAKFYLRESGLAELKVTLHTSVAAFPGAVDTALLYAESARKAGIEIEVARESADSYWSNVWMVKPWSFSYYSGRPTEDWMFSMVYESTAKWNETFWKNERFDSLLVQARTELDDAKRREMYVEMQKILSEEGGQIVPMFADFVVASSTKVAHEPAMASNWAMDGHRYCERWWFDQT